MTMGNPLNAHAQELESMTRNVSGIIPTTSNDFSISEQAVQGKIYDMYQTPKMDNKNYVDVVQQAEIAYLCHKSTCEEF